MNISPFFFVLPRARQDRTIREWLVRIDKDAKDARNRKIFEMWMACHAAEIAAAVDAPRRTVADAMQDFAEIANLAESGKAAANHATEFEPRLYCIVMLSSAR